MIDTIVKVWPTLRRVLIVFGMMNGLIAAIFWLSGVNPIFNGMMFFIGLVAFLLVDAKAEDDLS
jgi:hypothetical protein